MRKKRTETKKITNKDNKTEKKTNGSLGWACVKQLPPWYTCGDSLATARCTSSLFTKIFQCLGQAPGQVFCLFMFKGCNSFICWCSKGQIPPGKACGRAGVITAAVHRRIVHVVHHAETSYTDALLLQTTVRQRSALYASVRADDYMRELERAANELANESGKRWK